MSTIPQSLYRADQVRQLDRIAIDEFGTPGMTLMERAGSAAFTALHTHWPRAMRIAVVCGVGNNGGDGYVVARMADAAGLRVVVYQLGDRSKLTGDALTAFERLEGTHVDILQYDGHSFEMFDVVVDAMLGTGLQGKVTGPWEMAITAINLARDQDTAVLAIDIPSGLHADTGCVLGVAIKAHVTCTFIGMKQGMLTALGPDCCGEIIFNDLQVPQGIYAKLPTSSQCIELEQFSTFLRPRLRSTHKNQCGHVLVVGGDYGMSGAVRMAAEAAARSGAGLVSVATRPEHASLINISRPELMCYPIVDSDQLTPLLDKADVVAIGPGLGQDTWAQSLLSHVLESNLPLVVDADALNLLVSKSSLQRGNWVLTPHPGEAGRLLDCSTAEIQADRFHAVEEIRNRFAGVCVLKGCGTLVGCAEGDIRLCRSGNPGMASGGMGDVLTGVIAALIGQGLDLVQASLLGVCIHAHAADMAAQQGERGMLASDLFNVIRTLMNPR